MFKPELNLCGGMFSGHGSGSFRGKVYNPVIEEIADVSLYQDEIPNETVRAIADKLEACPFEEAPGNGYGMTAEEYADLKRMFRAYADAGATLKGWW